MKWKINKLILKTTPLLLVSAVAIILNACSNNQKNNPKTEVVGSDQSQDLQQTNQASNQQPKDDENKTSNLIKQDDENNNNQDDESITNEVVYQPNDVFLNKVKLKPKPLVIKTTNNDFIYDDVYPINVVIKKIVNTTLKLDELPHFIQVINQANGFKWVKPQWSLKKDIIVTSNMTIKGVINVNNKQIDVFAYILVQTQTPLVNNQLITKNNGLVVGVQNSEYNLKNLEKLNNMIDQGSNYLTTTTTWNKDANKVGFNNSVVFHYNQLTNLSQVKINFSKRIDLINNFSLLFDQIKIQTSLDGINWEDVKNQNKINSSAFGTFEPYSYKLNNTSSTQIITFDEIKTKWVKLFWTLPQQNINHEPGFGFANVEWMGKMVSSNDVIYNLNKTLSKIRWSNQEFSLVENQSSYSFSVDSLDFSPHFISSSAIVDQYLITSTPTKKVYKVIVYNDLNEHRIYTISFNLKELN